LVYKNVWEMCSDGLRGMLLHSWSLPRNRSMLRLSQRSRAFYRGHLADVARQIKSKAGKQESGEDTVNGCADSAYSNGGGVWRAKSRTRGRQGLRPALAEAGVKRMCPHHARPASVTHLSCKLLTATRCTTKEASTKATATCRQVACVLVAEATDKQALRT